jgi:hypothetical protein
MGAFYNWKKLAVRDALVLAIGVLIYLVLFYTSAISAGGKAWGFLLLFFVLYFFVRFVWTGANMVAAFFTTRYNIAFALVLYALALLVCAGLGYWLLIGLLDKAQV